MTEQNQYGHVTLRGRFDTNRILPGLPVTPRTSAGDSLMRGTAAGAVPVGTTELDLLPAVLFSFGVNPATYRRVDRLYQTDAQKFGLLASKSPLVGHPLFTRLSGIGAATARRLLGMLVYEGIEPSFAADVDRVVEKSWHRAWSWVANHDAVRVEEFTETRHGPAVGSEALDVESIVLVWEARRQGHRIVQTPGLQALQQSLLAWSVFVALDGMRPRAPAPVAPRDALSHFEELWARVRGGGPAGDLAAIGERVNKLAGTMLGDQGISIGDVSPETVTAACKALAVIAPRSRDTEAAQDLAWMVALSLAHEARKDGSSAETRLLAELEEVRGALEAERARTSTMEASLLSSRRLERRLEAEIRKEREYTDRLEQETKRRAQLEGSSVSGVPSLLPLLPVTQQLLVVGGSRALARRLASWMPNARFVAQDEGSLLDVAALRGCEAVVVLTSHVSHALADTVSDEARRQGIPLILVGWSNSARIVRAVHLALGRET